jgi:hypothetical protein
MRAALGALLPLVLLAGCATPRIALGTSQSPCYQALPVAIEAVGRQGRFAGVKRVTRSTLGVPDALGLPRRRRPTTTTQTTQTTQTTATTLAPSGRTTTTRQSVPPQSQGVCLVAFRGTFDRRKISLLVPPSSAVVGRYAVVVVSVRTRQARAVFLFDSLPTGFAHL